MTFQILTKDGFLYKANGRLYLSSSAGLETVVYAYYVAAFENIPLNEIGVSGNS